MQKEFQKATARDTQAAAYFSSEAFLQDVEKDLQEAIISCGGSCAHFMATKIIPKPQDMPYIQEAFKKLQEKYPELNNVRLNTGLAAKFGAALSMGLGIVYLDSLVFDTKPNTLGRRIRNGFKI
jgi:hypothetical protein